MNDSPKSSVAIVKSRLYKGGVFQVIQVMIKVLNKQGITPDVLTMKSDIQPDKLGTDYNADISFNLKEVLWNLKMPYEWHFLFFNLLSRRYLKKYDLVIDSNNTSFLSLRHSNKIIYIHFPRKERSLTNLESIHFPEGGKKRMFNFSMDPFRLSSFFYRWDSSISNKDVILANSSFTREAVVRNYDITSSDIQVIYPPIDFKDIEQSQNRDANLVVSLGRFSKEKRQLEQIDIASKLPGFQFCLIGFSKNESYLQKCKDRVQELGLNNVKILANAAKSDIDEIMGSARFFLHNVRNEPFGITSVEGIVRGLIPIVHDSGGQREIVISGELRYLTITDAAKKLEELGTKSDQELEHLSKMLIKNCQQFSTASFEEKFSKLIKDFINH